MNGTDETLSCRCWVPWRIVETIDCYITILEFSASMDLERPELRTGCVLFVVFFGGKRAVLENQVPQVQRQEQIQAGWHQTG